MIDAAQVSNADAILGSHDHVDHIDRSAWPTLAKSSPAAKFVVPILLKDRICAELGIAPDRVLGVDDGISIDIGPVKITGEVPNNRSLTTE